MIVEVFGHGKVKFPDSMSESEVRDVLRQFEPKKDNTLAKLLEGVQKLLKQKPTVIKQPFVVKEPQIIERERVITVPEVKVVETDRIAECEPVAWRFTIQRNNTGISEVIAEPLDG